MLALASLPLKTKAVALILTAAVASGGTLAGVALVQHRQTSLATVPQPSASPMGPTAGVADSSDPAPAPRNTPAVSAPPVANAYYGAPQAYTPTAPPQAAVTVPILSDYQLDQLLAPIALYSDPMIAEILPAATYPDELESAAHWLRYNPNAPDAAIEAQPWEPSIKSLAHSPSVLEWMAENPAWTRTLGTAFTYQQADVMESVQRLRAQAAAAGSLVTTPEQIVVVESSYICIVPARVDVIYVPVYDWRVCYTRRYQPTFFIGASIGIWWDHDCDWNDRFVTVGARWDRGWDHRWDHDRSSRPTRVTVNNTTINNTTINRTTVNNETRNVQVGGRAWQRDQAKPAPTLPASVKPASRVPVERAPAARTPARRTTEAAPITPPTTPTTPITPERRPDNRDLTPDRRDTTPPKTDARDTEPARRVPPVESPRAAMPIPPQSDREAGHEAVPVPAKPPEARGERGRGRDSSAAPARGADRGSDRGSDRSSDRGNRGDRGNSDK